MSAQESQQAGTATALLTATPVRTHALAAGDFVAVFRPEQGMICVSLKHRGDEILRLVDDMDEAVASGRSVGIPLLYPWANRLRGSEYTFDGMRVQLDKRSPWLLKDWNGILVHGVPWPRLTWIVHEAGERRLRSRLSWNTPELLAAFPFEHEVEMTATLDGLGLTIETAVLATGRVRVPVSFGFHPQLGLPGVRREEWRLTLPAMQGIVLDDLLLPLGERTELPPYDERLADLRFDHGFALAKSGETMSIAGNGRRVSVDFLQNYNYAQIYAQPELDYISLEPMVAPADALTTGDDLPAVEPGDRFAAVFRVRVEPLSNSVH